MSTYAKLTLLLTLCAACGFTTPTGRLPPGSFSYQEGWRHGCDSSYEGYGHQRRTWRYDYMRQKYFPEYGDGWEKGFTECQTRHVKAGQ